MLKYGRLKSRDWLVPLTQAALLALVVTATLWWTRLNPVTTAQTVLAYLLLAIPCVAYLRWKQQPETLPLFALIGFMYWIYYVLVLFWGDLTIQVARASNREAPAGMLTSALLMCFLGLCSLGLGMQARIGRRFIPRRLPEIKLEGFQRNYLRAVLIVTALLSIFEPSLYSFGEGGRQIITIVISLVPLLAFTLLFRLFLRGEATKVDKALIFGFMVTRMIVGLSSGWLGAGAALILIAAMSYLADRRRLPKLAILIVILFSFFFQAGKTEFRATYWTGTAHASQLDRASFWLNISFEKWRDALEDPSSEGMRRLANQSLSRVSLLTQSAHVLELTPSIVPYQNGALYSYLVITLVPRYFWPNKPSVSEANRFYQTAYGVTEEENLDSVAIGVGILTEAFINFGWVGVIAIMFLTGTLFDVYQRMLLGPSSGLLLSSLGIVLLPQMLTLESQMAAYMGGLAQQILLSFVVLLPIIRWTRPRPRLNLTPFPQDAAQRNPSTLMS